MPRIQISELFVNNVTHTSGLFYGQNVQCNWLNSEKINDGFGDVAGEGNVVQSDIVIVGDRDIVDTLITRNKYQG